MSEHNIFSADMTNEQAAFVEAMGRYLGSGGMTPMAGRMWGWLLICVPPEQTAAQLADELHASRGAISGTARILETVGFIKRTTRRGDRREYFSSPPETFRALLQGAGASYRRFRDVTEQGIGVIADLPPPARQRLEEVHAFVMFVEAELPRMYDRFVRERAQRAAEDVGLPSGQPEAITA